MVVDLELLKIDEPTPERIAQQVKSLINVGEIPVGSQLPTVHELAESLSISIGTVSAAWSILRNQQIVRGNGRQGIVVVKETVSPVSNRFASLNLFNQPIRINLCDSLVDKSLLPDLSVALNRAVNTPNLNNYQQSTIIPELLNTIAPGWPYPAEKFIVTNGVHEGIELLLRVWAGLNDTIAIETPILLSIFELVKRFKLKIIPIACDQQGPITEELQAALLKNPLLFIFQPRAHLPCGHRVKPKRLKEIASVLQNTSTQIIELDLLGDISKNKPCSIGSYLPKQTVHLRSYSRCYGPDFNLSILSANSKTIEEINNYRAFSTGWTSRIFQNALAGLLQDPVSQKKINKAKNIYFNRQQQLIDALFERGIDVLHNNGMNLWLPVYSEQYALAVLASRGIQVLGGSYFGATKKQPYIRVATTLLTEDKIDIVADALAEVVRYNN